LFTLSTSAKLFKNIDTIFSFNHSSYSYTFAGHIGEFPAHFCIKLIGTSCKFMIFCFEIMNVDIIYDDVQFKYPISDATSEKIVVRRCVMETMDTQCGKFRFEDDLLRGCILTCNMDGCNSSNVFSHSQALLWICLFFGLFMVSSTNLSSSSQATILPNLTTNIKKSQVRWVQQRFDAVNIKNRLNIPKKQWTAHAEPA